MCVPHETLQTNSHTGMLYPIEYIPYRMHLLDYVDIVCSKPDKLSRV